MLGKETKLACFGGVLITWQWMEGWMDACLVPMTMSFVSEAAVDRYNTGWAFGGLLLTGSNLFCGKAIMLLLLVVWSFFDCDGWCLLLSVVPVSCRLLLDPSMAVPVIVGRCGLSKCATF